MSYKHNPFQGVLDRVDVSSATIGGQIFDGTPNSVLFIDASGNLAEDANLTWDGSTLDVAGAITASTQLTVPLIETSATTGTLDIQPDTTGTGARVEFFKNNVLGNRPKIRLWGDGAVDTTTRYVDMYLDQYNRFVNEGTFTNVFFNAKFQIGSTGFSGNEWLLFGNNSDLSIGFSDVNIDQRHPMFLHGTNANTEPAFLFTSYTYRLSDFNLTETTPTILIHDGSATLTNLLKLYHDGTNGVISTAGLLDVQSVLQTDGYNSSDGSAGAIGTITLASTSTITVKNGLITAWA